MSRTSTLILLGILIILTPFSGFPIAIRTLLFVIFGACVAGIGFALRTSSEAQKQQLTSPTVSESSPPSDISSI